MVVNKSDKYYLKAGKLELSMLDDEDVTIQVEQEDEKKDLLSDLEFEHTRRIRQKATLMQPKLKVSRDVYNTLHTMGQFLTRQDEAYTMTDTKKNIISAKEQRLQKIASSIKVQTEEILPPLPKEGFNLYHSKEDEIKTLDNANISKQDKDMSKELSVEGEDLTLLQALEADETSVYEKSQSNITEDEANEEMNQYQDKQMNLLKIDEVILHEEGWKQEEVQEESLQDTLARKENNNVLPLEMYKPLPKYNSLDSVNDEQILEQQSIDSLLETFFGENQSNSSSYIDIKELKKHIEKQIRRIQSCK